MTVKLIGFQIVGMAALALWGGGEGTIPMYATKLNQESFPTDEQIREAINDGGFGCETIEGAVIRVDTLYEHGAKTYGEARYFNTSGYSDEHVMNVLSYEHPESSVSIWQLDDEILAKGGLA